MDDGTLNGDAISDAVAEVMEELGNPAKPEDVDLKQLRAILHDCNAFRLRPRRKRASVVAAEACVAGFIHHRHLSCTHCSHHQHQHSPPPLIGTLVTAQKSFESEGRGWEQWKIYMVRSAWSVAKGRPFLGTTRGRATTFLVAPPSRHEVVRGHEHGNRSKYHSIDVWSATKRSRGSNREQVGLVERQMASSGLLSRPVTTQQGP
jgi:hypothetical protein